MLLKNQALRWGNGPEKSHPAEERSVTKAAKVSKLRNCRSKKPDAFPASGFLLPSFCSIIGTMIGYFFDKGKPACSHAARPPFSGYTRL